MPKLFNIKWDGREISDMVILTHLLRMVSVVNAWWGILWFLTIVNLRSGSFLFHVYNILFSNLVRFTISTYWFFIIRLCSWQWVFGLHFGFVLHLDCLMIYCLCLDYSFFRLHFGTEAHYSEKDFSLVWTSNALTVTL